MHGLVCELNHRPANARAVKETGRPRIARNNKNTLFPAGHANFPPLRSMEHLSEKAALIWRKTREGR